MTLIFCLLPIGCTSGYAVRANPTEVTVGALSIECTPIFSKRDITLEISIANFSSNPVLLRSEPNSFIAYSCECVYSSGAIVEVLPYDDRNLFEVCPKKYMLLKPRADRHAESRASHRIRTRLPCRRTRDLKQLSITVVIHCLEYIDVKTGLPFRMVEKEVQLRPVSIAELHQHLEE